jgi:archaellum component FlaC
MENQTTIQKLQTKVGNILERYHAMKEELETLRNEVVALKAEKEVKDNEIARLADENAMKDLEIEEIVNKIENILG